MHASAPVHDTADRTLPSATVGVGWIRQEVPFHDSASVFCLAEPWNRFVSQPTATHAATPLHDTADNSLMAAPWGLGMAWVRQVVPFHPSASVRLVALGVM